MKKESNKKKKYWLIPAITLGLAIVLLIFRYALIKLYPCDIKNLPEDPSWFSDPDRVCHTPTKFHNIYDIATLVHPVFIYIGMLSLFLMYAYYSKKKWPIPVLCLLIFLDVVIKTTIIGTFGDVDTEGCKYGSAMASCVCDDFEDCSCHNRKHSSTLDNPCHVLNGYDLISETTINIRRAAFFEGSASIPIILVYTIIEKKKQKNNTNNKQPIA